LPDRGIQASPRRPGVCLKCPNIDNSARLSSNNSAGRQSFRRWAEGKENNDEQQFGYAVLGERFFQIAAPGATFDGRNLAKAARDIFSDTRRYAFGSAGSSDRPTEFPPP
jgi:hypothetical protein